MSSSMTPDLEQSSSTYPNTTETSNIPEEIVSDSFASWTQIIWVFGINGTFSVFGMVANIINIIVFVRQGILSDPCNVTLLGLAVADFGCDLTVFWYGVCGLAYEMGILTTRVDVLSIQKSTAAWPHIMTSFMTCWITVYLSFERFVCVTFPFKARQWFSPMKSLFIVCSIIIFSIACYLPGLSAQRILWISNPSTNTSILKAIVLSHYNVEIRSFMIYIDSIFMRSLAILLIFIFTQVSICKVNASKVWKQSNASLSSSSVSTSEIVVSQRNNSEGIVPAPSCNPDVAQREVKLVRMIAMISIIFLIGYIPGIVIAILQLTIDGIFFRGTQRNLFVLVFAVSFFFETIISSINILIYMNMSSKYKAEFKQLFKRC